MFTGIVEERGTVLEATDGRLTVAARKVARDSGPGASVAVNGACLTVVDRTALGPVAGPAGGPDGAMGLAFDLSPETISRTALRRLSPGHPVNLERPVTLMSRLGGHLVQGHVDAVGRIARVEDAGAGRFALVAFPEEMRRYVVEKGSVAVDGVSLTVTNVSAAEFGVALVPFTLEATTLGSARPGDPVNLEFDVIAKYVEGLLRPGREERKVR